METMLAVHAGKGWENYRSVFQRLSGRPCLALLPSAPWSQSGSRDAEPLLAPPQSARRRRSPRLAASHDRAPAAAPGTCDSAACEGEASDTAAADLQASDSVPAEAPIASLCAPVNGSAALQKAEDAEQQVKQAVDECAGRTAADGATGKGAPSAAGDVNACKSEQLEQAGEASGSAEGGEGPASLCKGITPQPPELPLPEGCGAALGGGDALDAHQIGREVGQQQGQSAAGSEGQAPAQAVVPRRQRGKRRSHAPTAWAAPAACEDGGSTGGLFPLATPQCRKAPTLRLHMLASACRAPYAECL